MLAENILEIRSLLIRAFGNAARGVVVVREVDLDMVLGPRAPWAFFRERVARTGEDAPAGRRKADHGGMTDAAARPGEKQRPPRSVVG